MPIINDKTIKELDQARQQRNILIQENTAYVKGNNPDTLNEEAKKKPDNRITIPFAKMAVETLCGYAGRAGDITINWENLTTIEEEANSKKAAKLDPYIELQKDIAEYNEMELETSQLYEVGVTQGESYELFWISTDVNGIKFMPEYKIIPNAESVVIWSSDIKRKLEAYLRFWIAGKDSFLDVYYPLYSERWEKLEKSDTWMRNKKGDTKYPYKEVPLAIYPINSDTVSIFQAEKDIITGNDKLLNKSVNEVDRFNAMIALFPQLVGKPMADKLVEMGIIDDLEQFERWPEYLQKDLNGVKEFYGMVADRLEKFFHKSIKIPDFSDENFVNAQSGLAMAYKLIGLEFLAAKIDQYFYKGLIQRNRLINDVISMDSKFNTDDYKMNIVSKRNLPMDKPAIVEMVLKLNGILSKETLLRFLPEDIVSDIEKELLLIEGEVPEVDLDNIPKITAED